jgi:hypothetical protein
MISEQKFRQMLSRAEPLTAKERSWERTVSQWLKGDEDDLLLNWNNLPLSALDNLADERQIRSAWDNPAEIRPMLLAASNYLPTPDWYQEGMPEDEMQESAMDWLNNQTAW